MFDRDTLAELRHPLSDHLPVYGYTHLVGELQEYQQHGGLREVFPDNQRVMLDMNDGSLLSIQLEPWQTYLDKQLLSQTTVNVYWMKLLL